MRDFYVFEIPVYLCAENAYYTELEAVEVTREKAPLWDFNQVVGWIRLIAERSNLGSRIKGHLWWVDARRLQKRTRKTFYLTSPSDILAAHVSREDDSEKIFKEVLAQIERIAKEPPLKGHYVDLRTFRNAGPFINWRELLGAAAGTELVFTMDNTRDGDGTPTFSQETLDAMNQELARRLGLSGPHELESLIGGERCHPIPDSLMKLFFKLRINYGDDEDTHYN